MLGLALGELVELARCERRDDPKDQDEQQRPVARPITIAVSASAWLSGSLTTSPGCSG